MAFAVEPEGTGIRIASRLASRFQIEFCLLVAGKRLCGLERLVAH